MNEFTESKLGELKKRVKTLIDEIRRSKNLKLIQIASAIGYGDRLSSFYKWSNESSYPNDYDVQEIVERLERLLETPHMDTFAKVSTLVSIFFDINKKNETYLENDRTAGEIVNINGQQAIIAYLNTTSFNRSADGLIYLHDAALEPIIKYGSIIAIRRIHKDDWRPGYFYLIIDTSEQLFVRRITEGKSSDEIILISENEKMYLNFKMPLSKILAMFRVEKMIVDP